MSADVRNTERKFNLGGWILFMVCAGLFIASSVNSGDILMLTASIIFLSACLVFIVPLVIRTK